jgi:hypothetical protein
VHSLTQIKLRNFPGLQKRIPIKGKEIANKLCPYLFSPEFFYVA